MYSCVALVACSGNLDPRNTGSLRVVRDKLTAEDIAEYKTGNKHNRASPVCKSARSNAAELRAANEAKRSNGKQRAVIALTLPNYILECCYFAFETYDCG